MKSVPPSTLTATGPFHPSIFAPIDNPYPHARVNYHPCRLGDRAQGRPRAGLSFYGILNPQQNRSWALYNAVGGAAGFYRPIRKGALSASQFPPTLKDQYGIRTITKPPTW